MDNEKAKVAILEIRKAIKAVKECGIEYEEWIVGDMELHIDELQNEIMANERVEEEDVE